MIGVQAEGFVRIVYLQKPLPGVSSVHQESNGVLDRRVESEEFMYQDLRAIGELEAEA